MALAGVFLLVLSAIYATQNAGNIRALTPVFKS